MFSNLGGIDLVLILATIIFSVGLHEAVHGFVAYKLGDTTALEAGRLTLNPIKHIDLITTIIVPMVMLLVGAPPFFVAKPVPLNPYKIKYDEYGVALVGLAGPFTNLALAILAAGIIHIAPGVQLSGLYNALVLFMQVNIALFVFNMIPFPPLDGSRLLYAFAPDPLRRVMETIESAGFFAILVFIFLAYQFISPIVVALQRSIFVFLLG